MKVVILCGGLGTRLQEETAVKPKPMVEIGGRPILWHIMNIYARQGFSDFILALGYKADVIKEYFLHYFHFQSDFSVRLADGATEVHGSHNEDWNVQLIDTGESVETGGRIKRLATHIGDETFMLTYGDGVADVDLKALLAFHEKHGCLATVTAVRPPSRFGGINIGRDNRVENFDEKPQIGEGWINGGFFVLSPRVLDYIDGEKTAFERAPMERLSSEGQLRAWEHRGFWQSMDTLRDLRLLEDLWTKGNAPWAK